MIDLLKKLFEQRQKKITVILLDDSKPDEDNSYMVYPNGLFGMILGISTVFAIFVALVFMLTPLGGLLYSTDDAEIRAQILEVTEKAIALEDSLRQRDMQLREMKNIIRLSIDTTLVMDERFDNLFDPNDPFQNSDFINFDESGQFNRLSQNEVLFSNVSKTAPDFPAKYPVQGSLTRGYMPDDEHYGLDIATKNNEPVINIADGSVFNSSWTINNGYVISVQHSEGVVTTYKHLAKLNKKEGDLVLKGDILGEIGNAGVLSTGPHLHFEIWKNGVPQNPEVYLIK
ncbi:MAG: M23 family metallopeptidase [Gracilimonas sp.]|uniref:M23 family metallopeptidase n=1 Tax=Gracilimonas TaxID=649462 RepID=UPI001B26B6B6|nr:M23 family metallopeptidase [Gracilimonas sp.]MBO6586693.1 M23 family metallopeptidase [Gracilimonas sp.]MBO6615350.1 M23 family metallopeptidase [Gracilimonas sp.]